MPPADHDVTELLQEWHAGDRQALDELMPRVFDELRLIARSYFAREASGHTLQPTALVNEVFLRLVDADRVDWQCRAQFFGIAARLMRCVLVDHARSRRAAKRGGVAHHTAIDVDDLAPEGRNVDLIALDDALEDLARINPEGSRVVEMRYFTGLTLEEIAEVLGVSRTTAKRKWRTARLWLHRELTTSERPADSPAGGESR